VLDTGATKCVLSKDGANRQRLKARKVTPVSYQFGLEGSTMVADEFVDIGTIGGYVVEGAVDNLIGTHDLLEAGNYLYADKEGGVIANRENSETIPIYRQGSQLRVWLTDVENYRVDSMAMTAQSKKRRSERESNVALAAALKKIKKKNRKSPGFRRSKPKKPGRLEKIRAEYNREYFSRPLRRVVPHAQEVVQGELGSGEHESGETVAEEDSEAILCEETTPTTSSARRRSSKPSVKLKEVGPQGTRKRRTPEEREMRASELSIGRVRLTPPPAHVLLRYIEIHERGHVNPKYMAKAVSGPNPAWRNSGLTEGQINRCAKLYKCPTCILAKRGLLAPAENARDPNDFSRETSQLNSKNASPGSIISMDPSGLISPSTAKGETLFFLFKDIKTEFDHVVLSKSQNTDSVKAALSKVLDWYIQQGCKPEILRVDDAKGLNSVELKSWLWTTYKVKIQKSIPYSHWQVAVERDMQTVVNGASALLHGQEWLKADSWDLALQHFVSIRNRTPNARTGFQSPLQAITKEALDFDTSFKFNFGDLVAVALPGNKIEKNWKFDVKNQLGIYCGQPETKGGNMIYWPCEHSISVRYSCWKIEVTDRQFMMYYEQRHHMREGSLKFNQVEGAFHDFTKAAELDEAEEKKWIASLHPLSSSLGGVDFQEVPCVGNRPTVVSPVHENHVERGTRRDETADERVTRGGTKYGLVAEPTSFEDYGAFIDEFGGYMFDFQSCFAATKTTVGSALKSVHRAEWLKAMKIEIDLLIGGGTLQLVKDSEIDKRAKIIHTTMQLKQKLHQDSTLDKWKARLCACGNELFGAVAETFAPTISALAYATVHQISVIDRMHKCTIDTVGAYLHQVYPVDAPALYVVLPSNVAIALGMDPKAKYRIMKYIYGLPDAGRAYYHAYSDHLISKGYARTASDPCLFVKINGTNRVYVWCHVDDTFVCSTTKAGLKDFTNAVSEKFKITVVDEVTEYLGISMKLLANGDCKLTQPKLLKGVLEEYKEQLSTKESRSELAPMRVHDEEAVINSAPMDQTEYLHLLGSLIYLTKSRPEIATAVSFAATYAAKPTVGAWKEMLYILRYLAATSENGIVLKGGVAGRVLKLRCYVDASYLTHRDSKSHSGYCMSFGQVGTFYSKSGKQTLVTTSSTHAEMRALYSLVVDIIYVVFLCTELRRPIELPCVILEDNQPVIDVTSSMAGRVKRCKHFLMLVNFVKEQVESGLIQLEKVDTKLNVADLLTKIVTGREFGVKAALLRGE
jgi:Reverse transcriptase (RNA-dependent DNA polymerase)